MGSYLGILSSHLIWAANLDLDMVLDLLIEVLVADRHRELVRLLRVLRLKERVREAIGFGESKELQ